MIPEKDIRDIQAYINGLMPSFRLEKFEARLKDPEFKAKYDELRPILGALDKIKTENRIKNIIKDIPKENIIEPETDGIVATSKIAATKGIKLLYIRWAVAASITVIFGIIGWDSYNLSRSKIINDSFGSFQNETRGPKNAGCPEKSTLNLFKKGGYNEFLKLLENTPKTTCNNFYIGITYLKLKDSEKAISLLKVASKDTINYENKYYQQNAEYYLSIAFLEAKKEEKAIEILKNIILKEEHQNKLSAIELLEKLNKKPTLFRIKAFD